MICLFTVVPLVLYIDNKKQEEECRKTKACYFSCDQDGCRKVYHEPEKDPYDEIDYPYDYSFYDEYYGYVVDDSTCSIKWNIWFNNGEKIYHLPWCPNYDDTAINTAYWERWFCSEQEAIDAGRRKAYNCY